MAPRLVCLGNFTLDDIVLPDGSEHPLCTGGDALYAALSARIWEPATEIVAPVGNDLPDEVIERMAGASLSADGMPRRDLPTLHNRIVYGGDGGRHWTLHASDAEFHHLSPTPHDIPTHYRNAEAFLILAMTLAAQVALAADLRSRIGALVALDPQEDYIAGNEAALRKLIALTDVFLPSAEEVLRLTGQSDWSAAARGFAELGPALVVIKLGPEGCLVFDRRTQREITVPAVPAAVVDTTGAGDSFCGAFMAVLAQDRNDIEAAAKAAVVTASFAVEGYGVDPLWHLDKARVTARLATL